MSSVISKTTEKVTILGFEVRMTVEKTKERGTVAYRARIDEKEQQEILEHFGINELDVWPRLHEAYEVAGDRETAVTACAGMIKSSLNQLAGDKNNPIIVLSTNKHVRFHLLYEPGTCSLAKVEALTFCTAEKVFIGPHGPVIQWDEENDCAKNIGRQTFVSKLDFELKLSDAQRAHIGELVLQHCDYDKAVELLMAVFMEQVEDAVADLHKQQADYIEEMRLAMEERERTTRAKKRAEKIGLIIPGGNTSSQGVEEMIAKHKKTQQKLEIARR